MLSNVFLYDCFNINTFSAHECPGLNHFVPYIRSFQLWLSTYLIKFWMTFSSRGLSGLWRRAVLRYDTNVSEGHAASLFSTYQWNAALRHRVQTGSGTHPTSYRMGIWVVTPGVKRPGRETNNSSLSSAELKNAWNYTSTPPIRLHGVAVKQEMSSWRGV